MKVRELINILEELGKDMDDLCIQIAINTKGYGVVEGDNYVADIARIILKRTKDIHPDTEIYHPVDFTRIELKN